MGSVLMTDNRTTELLCKLLEERGISWKKRRGYIRWSKQTKYGVTHYQAWPCFDGTITLTVRNEYGITPEQAVAATLGSEREKALEKLVQKALDECWCDEWWYEDARKLGMEANY